MKGFSFQDGVEFKIVTHGESWSPGQALGGTLEAIARTSQASLNSHVLIAEGNEKKIKSKTADAFSILKKIEIQSSPAAWEIALPLDTRITDKTASLYLLYGNSEDWTKLGLLKLSINPHLHLKDLCDLLISEFRFAMKNTPNAITMAKNNFVEFLLDGPSSREWAALDSLSLLLKVTTTHIEAQFQFNRQEVDAMQAGLKTKSVKKVAARAWPLGKVIHDFNQRLNKEIMATEIADVIREYQGTGWLS